MSRFSRLCLTFAVPGGVLVFLAIALAGLSACSPPATDDPPLHTTQTYGSCRDGDQDSGAKYRICMPNSWSPDEDLDLVVYAHGYVAYNVPVTIPENQLVVGEVSLPDIFNLLGYAFATTSYSTNGLAVREGIADLIDLVHVFTTTKGVTPAHVYLGGASEGGLITALAIEQHPDVFDGGLAACGPVGGMRNQIDYYGDFRIVFDYFFPGLLNDPTEPVTVPQWLIDGWDTHYATVISPAITDPANAYSLTQLLTVTGAAYEPGNPATMITTTSGLLWYTVFATNDAKVKLGGQPFDNWTRVYTGSGDDASLNAQVWRVRADQSALDEMEAHYRLTGWLTVPLVTLHTELDEIVPYWHVPMYQAMVEANNRTPWYHHISAPRYGHCNFEAAELFQAFGRLVYMVEHQHQVFLPTVSRGYDADE
jgi:pimeloyl-ACP methyl ester carboxylesterase